MALRSRSIADYVYILCLVETNRADIIRADEIVIYIYVEADQCDKIVIYISVETILCDKTEMHKTIQLISAICTACIF